jgi:hypothetical protein
MEVCDLLFESEARLQRTDIDTPSDSFVLSAHTPVPHQLRPATHLHNIHVLSSSRRHQSIIQLPPMREDRSCEHYPYLPVINLQLTRNVKALTKSQNTDNPPTHPTPASPRQHGQHQ